MSPEAQRIAIAEACPTVFYISTTGGVFWRTTIFGGSADPMTDLNAMHEAEKVLGDSEVTWGQYRDWLYVGLEPHRHVINATAAQRAEAFLRTIGKWEEAK